MSFKSKPKKDKLFFSKKPMVRRENANFAKSVPEIIRHPQAQVRQLRALISDPGLREFFSDLIKEVTGNEYDMKISSTVYSNELLEFARSGSFDLFILILNNIVFPSGNISFENRIRKSLQLVAHLKNQYQKPVIALAGWPHDSSLTKKAHLAGANFFLPLPFKPENFMEVIEKCLSQI